MKVSVKGDISAVFGRLRAKAKENLDAQFRVKVLERFKLLASTSPQWSGDFTSNWEISLDGAATYIPWGAKEEDSVAKSQSAPKTQMGDMEAVNYAVEHAKLVKFGYGSRISFTNATPLTFTDTTVTGGGTTNNVRPENLIDGRVALFSYLKSRFPA